MSPLHSHRVLDGWRGGYFSSWHWQTPQANSLTTLILPVITLLAHEKCQWFKSCMITAPKREAYTTSAIHHMLAGLHSLSHTLHTCRPTQPQSYTVHLQAYTASVVHHTLAGLHSLRHTPYTCRPMQPQSYTILAGLHSLSHILYTCRPTQPQSYTIHL